MVLDESSSVQGSGAGIVERAASVLPAVSTINGAADFKGSDAAAAMMAAMQKQGGKAVYFGLGTELKDVHHNPYFDFDERVLPIGVDLLIEAIKHCAGNFRGER